MDSGRSGEEAMQSGSTPLAGNPEEEGDITVLEILPKE